MCLFGISGTELHSKSKHTCLQWESSELANHARTNYWRVIKGRGKTCKDDFAEKLLLIKVDSWIYQSDKLPVILLYFFPRCSMFARCFQFVDNSLGCCISCSRWFSILFLKYARPSLKRTGWEQMLLQNLHLIQRQWCLSRSAYCKYHRHQNTSVLSDMQAFDLSTDNNLDVPSPLLSSGFSKKNLKFLFSKLQNNLLFHKEKTTAPCSGLFFPR